MASKRFRGVAPYALGLLLVVATAGCGKDSSPSRPVADTGDPVSQQAANDIARHFGASLARQGGLPLDQAAGSSLSAVIAQPSAAARMQNDGDFSWWLSIKFYDSNGAEQTTYQEGTTSRMTVEARVRGRIAAAEHQARVGVHRWLDVQGLLPDETTLELDGTASDTADCAFASSDGSEERSYHLLAGGQLVDVMKLKDEHANPYPLSGTAQWKVTADASTRDKNGTAEAHYEATVVVTFNGTRHPTIQVDKKYTYRTDLETGEVVPLPS